jgi:hypothetical protein
VKKSIAAIASRWVFRNVNHRFARSGFRGAAVGNNIGAWPTRSVKPPSDRKDFSYYAAKDLVMAQEAKCGVMLWDAKSKGTLQNMLNLIGAGKRTLVYFAPTKDFFVVATEQDLQTLLHRCEQRDLDTAARGLGLKTPLSQPHLPLSLTRS